ncbi:MAG: Uma2 family endonuclease [Planctomycetota bacterium]
MPQTTNPPPPLPEDFDTFQATDKELGAFGYRRKHPMDDSLDRIMRALNEDNGLEYVDKVIIEKDVSKESARVATRIATYLNNAGGLAGIAEVYGSDLTYRCWADDPDRRRRPDASLILSSRLAELGDDVGEMPIVPDLCIEVVSPGDLHQNFMRKMTDYRDADFPLIWVVNPELRTCNVVTGSIIRQIHSDDVLELPDLLPDFRHTLGELIG